CGLACQLAYTALGAVAVALRTPGGFEPSYPPGGSTPGVAYGVGSPPSVLLLALVGEVITQSFFRMGWAFVLFLLLRRPGWAWGAYFVINVGLRLLMNSSNSWVGNGLVLTYALLYTGFEVLLLARFGL